MDENADASQVIFTFQPLPESWRHPRRRPRTNLDEEHASSLDLELYEARAVTQNLPLWRLTSLYSASLS